MKVGIAVGLGLGIGIAFLSGGASSADEANAPPAAAPTPLLPATYSALSASVASAASPAAPARLSPAPVASTAPPAAQAPLSPLPAAVPTVAARTVTPPAIKFNQYHPHWVVDVH